MSLIKDATPLPRVLRQVACFAGLWALMLSAGGEFKLVLTRFDVPERGALIGYALLTRGQRITFLPSIGWKPEAQPSRSRVVFSRDKFGYELSFRLVSPEELDLPFRPLPPDHVGAGDVSMTDEQKRDLESARRHVERSLPGYKIMRTEGCFADATRGTVFQLESEEFGGQVSRMRVALVAFPFGVVEFQSVAPLGDPVETEHALAVLMSTFRIARGDPQGIPSR